MSVRVVHSARYHIDIGLHVFPTRKYQLVRDSVVRAGLVDAAAVVESGPASWEELALVHTNEYLTAMRHGTLAPEQIAQLELPWSAAMVDGFRIMVGGTIAAARLAVDRSAPFNVVCHIGGGLHHAFRNHGEGFCPFNDVAVAIRALQRAGTLRHTVIDLDVHHGNGTAFIFESDPDVFTFSMHQQHNYPVWKPRSSLDIGLPDGVHDATYLEKLTGALPTVLSTPPDCVFYLAGADPFEDDQLGGLRLTREGLRQRDRMVIEAVRSIGRPLVIVLAGGYARRVEDTVAIHVGTIEEAASSAAG